MKKQIGYIRLLFWFKWYLFKYDIKSIFRQVRECLVLFIIVNIVMSSEVWIPYLVYFITKNTWWLGIGSACWLFWLGPGTPFIPLCIAITLGIHKLKLIIKGS